ncbi:flagellar brake protein [Chitinimonas lacunae]|uniref:Flagellar brake protein YcgR n=1 Tax=Chitinimonas lacunae TaxID=1963018 RepID=A0ABV8MRF1_9NEIS
MADTNDQQAIALIPEGVDVSAYLLRTPLEIGYVLRTMAQKSELFTVYFDHGHNSMLTTLLDADSKAMRFWFDVSSSDAINRSLLRADRVVFAAAPEGVKVQFVLDGNIEFDEFEGQKAFVADFPADMIKLQRREFFRLETPVGKPLVCKLPHPSGRALDLTLHDISIGGIGLWYPGNAPNVEILDIFHNCQIDLATFGLISVSLEIRAKRRVTQRNGSTLTMLGCRFVNLPRQTENILQRYMAQLERERHQLLRK